MATAICQAGYPVKRGKRASWGCDIVYSVGRVNFFGRGREQQATEVVIEKLRAME